MHDLVLDW